jgi:hypothetical protein
MKSAEQGARSVSPERRNWEKNYWIGANLTFRQDGRREHAQQDGHHLRMDKPAPRGTSTASGCPTSRLSHDNLQFCVPCHRQGFRPPVAETKELDQHALRQRALLSS